MRVITGAAKGKRLITLEGMDVRPTADRVKEGVFSSIHFDIPYAKVLDLFAGSGQLGIEALSRGAASCVFVDESVRATKIITQNLENTKLKKQSKIINSNAITFIEKTEDIFDIIFLDPPFRKGFLEKILPIAALKTSDNGIILCEHAADEKLDEEVLDIVCNKQYKYSKVCISVYRKKRFYNEKSSLSRQF